MREQFRGLKCSRECALIDLEVTANFNCQQLNTERLKVFDRTGLAYTSPVRFVVCCLLVKGAENDGFKIEVDVLFPYVQKMVTNNSQGHFCYDTFFRP